MVASSRTVTVKVKPEIDWSGSCTIAAGDTLIVGLAGHYPPADLEAHKVRVESLLPGVTVFVMSGVSALAVRRPGVSAPAATTT